MFDNELFPNGPSKTQSTSVFVLLCNKWKMKIEKKGINILRMKKIMIIKCYHNGSFETAKYIFFGVLCNTLKYGNFFVT